MRCFAPSDKRGCERAPACLRSYGRATLSRGLGQSPAWIVLGKTEMIEDIASVVSSWATANPQLFELIKLVLQFIGALGVARLTVRWALGRFKNEKLFEQKVLSYTKTLSAINEMWTLCDQMMIDEIQHRDRSAEFEKDRRQRYYNAQRDFYSALSLGELIFSDELNGILEKALRGFDDRHKSFQDEMEYKCSRLAKAKEAVIAEGKKLLEGAKR